MGLPRMHRKYHAYDGTRMANAQRYYSWTGIGEVVPTYAGMDVPGPQRNTKV